MTREVCESDMGMTREVCDRGMGMTREVCERYGDDKESM